VRGAWAGGAAQKADWDFGGPLCGTAAARAKVKDKRGNWRGLRMARAAGKRYPARGTGFQQDQETEPFRRTGGDWGGGLDSAGKTVVFTQ